MGEDINVYSEKLDPSTGLYVSMALVRDVKNCKVLKEKVMSGALQCSIMKPSLIVHPFQVIVAANRAAISYINGTMVTKSVYTELLFNLSISKNISQSLIKFGIHENDEDVLIACIHKDGVSDLNEVISQVEGHVVPFSKLEGLCDSKLVVKSYKISEDEVKMTSLIDSIVSRIATSEFVSH